MSKKAVVLRNRNGQALIEFAFISVVLTLFIMGILGLGMMLIHATATASTSINASMLFDMRIESDETLTPEDIYQQLRRDNIYNDKDLVLTRDEYLDPDNVAGDPTREQVDELNQKMLSLYQYDIDRDVFRYPGTVLRTEIEGETEDVVLIPILNHSTQTITAWHRPVEIEFSYESMSKAQTGDVNIWMASQPGTLFNYQTDSEGNGTGGPLLADDSVISASLPSGYAFPPVTSPHPSPTSTNRGQYGLGELGLGAIGDPVVIEARQVRPYRRVFVSRGVFRLSSKPEEAPTP